MELDKQQQKFADMLKPHLALIQAFMVENITPGKAMVSRDILNALKDRLTNVDERYFSAGLSACTRAGMITGFEGKRRVGYILTGDKVSIPGPNSAEARAQRAVTNADKVAADHTEDDDSDEIDSDFTLQITSKFRIIVGDKRNFVLQQLSGETWGNSKYYSTLFEALRGGAKSLTNTAVRDMKSKKDVRELIVAISSMEANILEEIKNHCNIRSDKRPNGSDINSDSESASNSEEHAA